MSFELQGRDKEGNPTHVNIDDGYMQTSRKFDMDEDAWMLDQLNPCDFDIIAQGRQMEALLYECNDLRKKNYHLNKMLNTAIGG